MRRPLEALCVVTVLALVGCSGGKPQAEPPAAAAPASARPGDPCSLLTPAEVAVVLGPPAGAPYRTRDVSDDGEPAADGDACRYEARDLRSLKIVVTWTDGALVMRMIGLPGGAVAGGAKGQIPGGLLPEGVAMTGEWDEAVMMGCCRIVALRGDSAIALDYAASRATGEQAVTLLNAALQRLDAPLAVDGRAGSAAAQQRIAARPARRPACQLVTRAEAEAIFGALGSDPHGDDASCLYPVTAKAAFDAGSKETSAILNMMASHTQVSDVRLVVKWRNGFAELRNGVAMIGETEKLLKKWESSASADGPAQVVGGSWDDAWESTGGFMAVKKDVMVSVEMPSMLSGADKDRRRQLVGAAIGKL